MFRCLLLNNQPFIKFANSSNCKENVAITKRSPFKNAFSQFHNQQNPHTESHSNRQAILNSYCFPFLLYTPSRFTAVTMAGIFISVEWHLWKFL